MPRIRTIKPEFWDSPDTAKATAVARLLYIAMWNWADDAGRGTANLKELEGFAFPNDDVAALSGGNSELRHVVTEVQNVFGVVFYTVEGRPYYEIPSWIKHQRNERRAQGKHPPSEDGLSWDVTEAPTSSATPARKSAEDPKSSVLGTGEQGNRRTEEPPYPPHAETSRREPRTHGRGKELDRISEANMTARSVDAYRIAEAFSASLRTPIENGLLAGVGVQIDKCLKSNIPPAAIAEGLKAWTASDSWSPTQIPNFVHKANNRPTNGKATAKAIGYDEALAELLQEVETL